MVMAVVVVVMVTAAVVVMLPVRPLAGCVASSVPLSSAVVILLVRVVVRLVIGERLSVCAAASILTVMSAG